MQAFVTLGYLELHLENTIAMSQEYPSKCRISLEYILHSPLGIPYYLRWFMFSTKGLPVVTRATLMALPKFEGGARGHKEECPGPKVSGGPSKLPPTA
jgi:hypothetical protein